MGSSLFISPLLSTDGNTIAGELRYSGEDESFSDLLSGNSYRFLSWGLSRCFNALASICWYFEDIAGGSKVTACLVGEIAFLVFGRAGWEVSDWNRIGSLCSERTKDQWWPGRRFFVRIAPFENNIRRIYWPCYQLLLTCPWKSFSENRSITNYF